MSRWVELYATTPSGKTLFVCRMCGRQTPAPGQCSAPPEVYQKMPLDCELLEGIEEALADETGNARNTDGSEDPRVMVVGEKPESTPNGKRTSVVWSSLKARWNSTEVYLEREEDKKK